MRFCVSHFSSESLYWWCFPFIVHTAPAVSPYSFDLVIRAKLIELWPIRARTRILTKQEGNIQLNLGKGVSYNPGFAPTLSKAIVILLPLTTSNSR